MNNPGFTAAASLPKAARGYLMSSSGARPAATPVAIPQALGRFGRLGGFGPTLPYCYYEWRWTECGSALPGYPVPMCWEQVYVCKFPGSSRNLAM